MKNKITAIVLSVCLGIATASAQPVNNNNRNLNNNNNNRNFNNNNNANFNNNNVNRNFNNNNTPELNNNNFNHNNRTLNNNNTFPPDRSETTPPDHTDNEYDQGVIVAGPEAPGNGDMTGDNRAMTGQYAQTGGGRNWAWLGLLGLFGLFGLARKTHRETTVHHEPARPINPKVAPS